MKKLIVALSVTLFANIAFADIINTTNVSTTPTVSAVVANDRIMISSAYKNLKHVIARVFNDIWNSPYGYTPQQMFDGTQGGWGTDSAQLLGVFGGETGVLQSVDNSYIPPQENAWTITPDQDGTVTLNAVVNGT
jgi:hypothetical protein